MSNFDAGSDTSEMSTSPPTPAQANFARGFEHHQAGRIGDAAAVYRAVLAGDPGHVDALHLLGLIEAQSGRLPEAERLMAQALALDDAAPLIWSNYGNVLDGLGRPLDAIASYDRALALAPDHADAVFNRACVLSAQGRASEALAGFESTGQLTPGRPVVGTARANALVALGRTEEALELYDAVLAVAPGYVDAMTGRAAALKDQGLLDDAIAGYEGVVRLAPTNVPAQLGLAHALVLAGRARQALDIVAAVLAGQPGNAEAWYIKGHALLTHFETAAALDGFERAAGLKPSFVEAVYNQANALRLLGRYGAAITAFNRVLALHPDHTHALNGLATAAMQGCDWAVVGELAPRIEAKVVEGGRGLMPFSFISLSDSQQLQLECARTFARHACPIPAKPLDPQVALRRGKIRLGYLSSDFRRHAMAYQMAELFELHDRERFDVIGFSGGPDDGSAIRQRIARGFDAFHDVAAMPDRELAMLMRRERIDIAIDLNGHTVHSRLAALAYRPAPVQATYLGFPGTTGTGFIDYVIADRVVAPVADQAFFSEAIVHMPDCYQVSDSRRQFAHLTPRRADYGLPEHGFVLCCFNSSYKISAPMFAVWMRLLAAIPGSVLWLVRGNDAMRDNLRAAARTAGIDPARVVFCEVVEPDAHLARHALADLYLDTLPYNSHGTGSFALWAGLPMVTCLGPTFAGRVCASLLGAIGMPELVTGSMADYETLALGLARDPAKLAGLRRRLGEQRLSAPLFDTGRFRRHIERAYTQMWDIACAGERPSAFAVPADTTVVSGPAA